MNRKTKAAVAGTAAALLLFSGGAGTFARWYDEAQPLDGKTITSGKLELAVKKGEWKINPKNSANPTEDFTPGQDTIVPGDVITYTAEITPTIVGKNLEAKLVIDTDSLPAGGGDWVIQTGDTLTENKINVGLKLLDDNDRELQDQVLVPADSGNTKKVKVTVTFPEFKDSTNAIEADDAGKTWWHKEMHEKSIELTNLKLALRQTDRTS